MKQPRHSVIALRVGKVELLLTVTSGGSAIHLAQVANPVHTGRAAVHDWAPMTMCGRK